MAMEQFFVLRSQNGLDDDQNSPIRMVHISPLTVSAGDALSIKDSKVKVSEKGVQLKFPSNRLPFPSCEFPLFDFFSSFAKHV